MILMSKSQARALAAALRRGADDPRPGLVRVGYAPQRGYVVEIVRQGRTEDVWSSGVTKPLFEEDE